MDKQELRAVIRERLRSADAESLRLKSMQISKTLVDMLEFLSPSAVLFYIPMRLEADIRPAVGYALGSGITVLLPRVNGTEIETVRFFGDYGSELQKGAFGILEPVGKSTDTAPDVIITPLLSVDKYGNRLGKGRGYYDRYFSRHEKAVKIGVAFGEQVIESVPIDAHDIKLDAVIADGLIIKDLRERALK